MIDLGRNFSWDKDVDKTLWKDLQNHEIIRKHKFQALDLSMMAMSLGFKHNVQTFQKGPIGSGVIFLEMIQKRNAVTLILSIAVEHTGSLDILEKDGSEIRKIAEEYANGGLAKLHKIFMDSNSDKAIIAKLVKIMEDLDFVLNSFY